MAAETSVLDSFQVGEKHYTTTQAAAKWLGISHERLKVLIVLGKIEATQFGLQRQFIDLDTLRAFDVSKYPARRGR